MNAQATLAPRGARPAVHAYGFSLTTLQRTGARPLRFFGQLLYCHQAAECASWTSLRLALYAGENGDFITEIQLFQGSQGWHDARAGTLPQALSHFESAQPALNTSPFTKANESAALALLQAAAHLCNAASQDRAFRHATGEFLLKLCQSAQS
jgi:hypothetical protein